MSTEKGISIVEIIFSIGVTVLVISGTISLLVKSTGIKTATLQRKRASELAEKVVEELIDQKNNNGDSFWSLNEATGLTFPEFKNYTYDIGYSRVVGVGCSAWPSQATCVQAEIKVNWGENDSQNLWVKRFFSRLDK